MAVNDGGGGSRSRHPRDPRNTAGGVSARDAMGDVDSFNFPSDGDDDDSRSVRGGSGRVVEGDPVYPSSGSGGGGGTQGGTGGGTSGGGSGGTGGGGGRTGGGSSGGSGGGGGGAGFDSPKQIPGGVELWAVNGRGYKLAYKIPDTDKYLIWDVESMDRLEAIFGTRQPDVDQRMAADQYRKRSPIRMGLSAELQNTSEHPWRQFMSNFREEAKRRPWLNDPTVLATMAGAYLEGREPSRDELAETDWWNEHTAEERELMEFSVTAGRSQVRERLREEAQTWLGPEFGNMNSKQIDRWARRVHRDPAAADEFLDKIKGQNKALFSDFYGDQTDRELTYEDITEPFRNLGQQVWGQPFDDEGLLVQIANKKDYSVAASRLREVGLNRGVDKVVDDALEGLGSTAAGEQVVQSASPI